VDVTLYSMAISHPARTAGLMLAHKGIEAKRVEMPPGSQQAVMRMHGFRHGTVPGLKIDGRRVQGTVNISRALDEAQPDPPLFPADPGLRAAVEEAERWGDEVYQPVPRRIFRWAASSNRDLRGELAKTAGMPAPAITSHLLWPMTQIYLRFEGGGEAAARRDVGLLPDHLDHVDGLISAGTIDGAELNAADFQIGTTTRVLLNFSQLRHLVEGRPAAEHANRVAAGFGRDVPITVPPDWIPAA